MTTCRCIEVPRMRTSVQVQKPNDSATADASGHIDWSADASWITVDTFPCSVATRGGAENWRFRQLESEVTRIFQVRSTTRTRLISPRYRLRTRKDDGSWRVHDVAAAFDVDAARRVVEIHAKEVV